MAYLPNSTSGKAKIYSGINKVREALKRLKKDDPLYKILSEALNELNHGQWMNEEQLKALYKAGYREGDWLTWLPDDFDDEY
jgi:hypothetical protein